MAARKYCMLQEAVEAVLAGSGFENEAEAEIYILPVGDRRVSKTKEIDDDDLVEVEPGEVAGELEVFSNKDQHSMPKDEEGRPESAISNKTNAQKWTARVVGAASKTKRLQQEVVSDEDSRPNLPKSAETKRRKMDKYSNDLVANDPENLADKHPVLCF